MLVRLRKEESRGGWVALDSGHTPKPPSSFLINFHPFSSFGLLGIDGPAAFLKPGSQDLESQPHVLSVGSPAPEEGTEGSAGVESPVETMETASKPDLQEILQKHGKSLNRMSAPLYMAPGLLSVARGLQCSWMRSCLQHVSVFDLLVVMHGNSSCWCCRLGKRVMKYRIVIIIWHGHIRWKRQESRSQHSCCHIECSSCCPVRLSLTFKFWSLRVAFLEGFSVTVIHCISFPEKIMSESFLENPKVNFIWPLFGRLSYALESIKLT